VVWASGQAGGSTSDAILLDCVSGTDSGVETCGHASGWPRNLVAPVGPSARSARRRGSRGGPAVECGLLLAAVRHAGLAGTKAIVRRTVTVTASRTLAVRGEGDPDSAGGQNPVHAGRTTQPHGRTTATAPSRIPNTTTMPPWALTSESSNAPPTPKAAKSFRDGGSSSGPRMAAAPPPRPRPRPREQSELQKGSRPAASEDNGRVLNTCCVRLGTAADPLKLALLGHPQ
jgi:hypothetical protein